jgi:hypothetical protein
VVGVSAIGLMTPGVENTPPSAVASYSAPASQGAPFAETGLALAQTTPPQPVLESPSLPTAQSGYELVSQPRYVIDARPASYEPSASFNF